MKRWGWLVVSLWLASTAAADDSGNDRATTFQAVEGAVKEDVPGGPLLVSAYAFAWLAVLGYVWRLSRLSARTDESLQRLQRALGDAPKG
jgi:CcmD family protein